MFTVRANGTQYSMTFQQSEVKRLTHGGFEDVIETVCRIYQQDQTLIATGQAARSPFDQEDTPKALEISMGRALEGVSVLDIGGHTHRRETKEFRAAFWAALREAIWNTFLPVEEMVEAEPRDVTDAIPLVLESEAVRNTRARVAAFESDHAPGGPVADMPSANCPGCNLMRAKLADALAAV